MRAAAAGVYVPSREVSHAGHELTQKILRSKTSREHDPLLARLLHGVAARNYPSFKPDLVVSLPPKPGEEDRFRNIRRALAGLTGAADASSALADTRVVPNYRRMSAAQRIAASDMRYLAAAPVRANSVLLIDDVLTTGAQASDAIRALVAAGATEVRFACVARAIEGPGQHTRGEPHHHAARRMRSLSVRAYDHVIADRVVLEVVSVDPLPLGASGSRRAVVCWSDGTVGEALRWWHDEVLFCEGDLLGKTEAQLRSLHFRRDRDYLRAEPV